MPRKKDYKITALESPLRPDRQVSQESKSIPRSARLLFAELLGEGVRTSGSRGIDLTEWLGRGIDDWVWAAVDAYIAKLHSGTSQTSTINNESRGIAKFFAFLVEGRAQPLVAHPRELTPLIVTQFVAWLLRRQEAFNLSSETTRSAYKGAKSTFVTLMEHGVIEGDPKRFFGVRVLPHKNFAPSRAQPYSESEQQRLADALRRDLVDIHHGRLELTPSSIIATYFLVVAMRTGANVTPLLELRRDGLRQGLLPGTQYLQLHKHRGGKIISRVLKRAQTVEPPLFVPMDAVAVVERVLIETASLAAEASAHLKDRVWLFKSRAPSEIGVIKHIRRDTLETAIRGLVARRGLLDDDGKPFQVLTTRLRQSLSKRAWRLSGGDPIAVAAVLGNTPRVADSYYLRVDDSLKAEAATYMGKEFTVHLRAGGEMPKVLPSVVEDSAGPSSTLTPVGRCKDSLHGQHAPKDGSNFCDQFVLCLFCPSFAVAGELDDLWRLYSFQRFAIAEIDYHAANHEHRSSGGADIRNLRELYEAAVPFIDRFCEHAFSSKIILDAKAKAQSDMHPFWKHLMMRNEVRRAGRSMVAGDGESQLAEVSEKVVING